MKGEIFRVFDSGMPLEVWRLFLPHTVTPYAVVILSLSLLVDIVEQYLL